MSSLSFLDGSATVIWGVNVVLQITLVMAVALFLSRFLARDAAARYWVLFSALAFVLVSPFTAALIHETGYSAFSVALLDHRTTPGEVEMSGKMRRLKDLYPSADSPASSETDLDILPSSIEQLSGKNGTPNSVTTTFTLGKFLRVTMPPFLLIWLVGALVFFARLCFRWQRLAAILQSAELLSVESVEKVVADACRAVGMRKIPQVLSATGVTSPIAVGVWRPQIVLPAGIVHQMTTNQLRQMLTHELAHVLRGDPVVAILQNLATVAFWCHPLVRPLNRQLACAREEICDNYVLSSVDGPSYSRMLLRLAELISSSRPQPASVGLLTSHWKLETRVAGILDERRQIVTRLTNRSFVIVLMLSCLLAAVGSLATIAPAVGGPIDQDASQRKDSDSDLALDNPDAKQETQIPFRIRSREFQGQDDVLIESFVELDPKQNPFRYEVRGRYRLQSRAVAQLAQWCSNGALRGNEGVQVQNGEGEFRFTFSVVKNGNLHISYYPQNGGNSFGSIYYYSTQGPLHEEQPSPSAARYRSNSSRESSNVNWKTDQTKFFRLHYSAEFQDDATLVKSFLEQAVTNLQTEFGSNLVPPLLTSASIDVYLHPRPTERAREGLMWIRTETKQGIYCATINMLTPTAHRSGARTSVGEPMDENYIFKNLVHEYSTIVLDRMTRTKNNGWRFFSAPSWFVQGYEEYLGLMLSSEHSRNVTFEKYRDLLRIDPSRVTPEFEVKNSYLDGSVLMQFLHETYGKETVHALLLSDAVDFWSAVMQATGHDRHKMHEAWKQWSSRI